MQPIVDDEDRVPRFHANRIVAYCAHTVGLNVLAGLGFAEADWVQLAQLLGYSLAGAADLSYMPRTLLARAARQATRRHR